MVTPAPSVALKDVEWRVDSEPKDGRGGTRARFVPHINARIAASLMDEWVGPMYWADEYRTVTIAGKEAILCTVSVRVDTIAPLERAGTTWISKQDVGVPSHTEAQKGAISDAFKRVVTVKWGCGRNVYDLPTLWAPCKAVSGRDGKSRAYATDETLPDLLWQLKQKGFDADGCRLEDSASDEDAGAARATDATQTRTQAPAPATSPPLESARSGPTDDHARPEPGGGSIPPTSSASVGPTSKNRVGKLQSRLKMMQTDGFRVAKYRDDAGLPPLNAECTTEQLDAWEALLEQHDMNLERTKA